MPGQFRDFLDPSNALQPSYLLRGIAFYLDCGATLYTRRQAAGRMYICANVRTSTGLCSAAPIPATLIERHVLSHLHVFIGSVESWIAERVQERDVEQAEREAAVGRERARLADLDPDRERAAQERVIDKASAVVSEWAGPPDTDAALDFYGRIVDLGEGRVRAARAAPASSTRRYAR
jgi:hypothetical protein